MKIRVLQLSVVMVLSLTASRALANSSVYVDVVGGDAVLASGAPGSALKVTATQLVGSVDIMMKADVTGAGILAHSSSLINFAGGGNATVSNFVVHPLSETVGSFGPSITNFGAQLALNFGASDFFFLNAGIGEVPIASFTLNFDLNAGTPTVIGQVAANGGWANANSEPEQVRYGPGLFEDGTMGGAGRGLLFTIEIPEPSTALLLAPFFLTVTRRRR